MASFYWVFLNRKHQIQSPKLSQRRAERLVLQLKSEDIRYWWAWNPSFTEWIPLKNLVVEQEGRYKLAFKPAKGVHTNEATQTRSIVETQSVTKKQQMVKNPKQRVAKKIVFEDSISAPKEDSVFIQEKPVAQQEEVVFRKVDFAGDDFTWSGTPRAPDLFGEPLDRRGAERFDIRIEVLIMSHGRSFRSFTDNVSMTGAILEKAIPNEFLTGHFEVAFISRYQNQVDRILFKGKIAGSLADPRRLTFTELPEESRLKLMSLIQRHIQHNGRKTG